MGNVTKEISVETKTSFDAKAESRPYLSDMIAVIVAAGIADDRTATPVTTGSIPTSLSKENKQPELQRAG